MNWKNIFKEQVRGLYPALKVGLLGLALALAIFIIFAVYLKKSDSQISFHQPPPVKGMALGLFSKEKDYDYGKSLKELKQIGVNAILLMVPWYQTDIYANRMEPRFGIGPENSTPPDGLLKDVIKKAHALELQVALLPYLRFDHRKRKEWRGVLKPNDLETWKKAYFEFLLYYAERAAAWQVEMFSVGSELGSMETDTPFWKDLIQQVRKKYSGKLFYSANWDHYQTPKFWQDLDYLGMTAYYDLTGSSRPTLGTMLKKWKKIKETILEFQAQYPDKKILFTEVGYPSINGGVRKPWDYTAKQRPDLKEQALGYQAFIQTWNGTPQLAGVFWWVWYGEGGPQDKDYTPKGKPAEDLLRRWYLGVQAGPN